MLPRALSYLAAKGVRDIGMAVVFQMMVRADAAGVAFTAAPAGTSLVRPGEMLVNVALGLGAPVVDGASTPDAASVDQATGNVIEYGVADKAPSRVGGDAGLREGES